MFSQGQWIFAGFFAISFIIIITYSYRKDLAIHRAFYKGNYKIVIGFLLFIASLFIIKIFLKR